MIPCQDYGNGTGQWEMTTLGGQDDEEGGYGIREVITHSPSEFTPDRVEGSLIYRRDIVATLRKSRSVSQYSSSRQEVNRNDEV